MKQFLIGFLFCFFSFSLTAGAWLQGKSKGYFKLNQSYMSSGYFYDNEGSEKTTLRQSFSQTSLYGEVGLLNKMDLIVNFPFLSSHKITSGEESLLSIGDLDVAVKVALSQSKPLKVSLALKLGIPTGKEEISDTYILQTGDGEFNQEVTLEFGKSLISNMYAELAIGFNQRNSGYSDEFKLDAGIGVFTKRMILISFKTRLLQSLYNGDKAETEGFGVFSNNIEYFAYGPEIAFPSSTGVGIYVNLFAASYVKNILASPQINFGFFYDF